MHSCKKSSKETDFSTCTQPTYEDDIKSLLETHCNNIDCHGGRQQPVLTYWSAVKAAVDNGSIQQEVVNARTMPKVVKLSQEEYDMFNCWLTDGAPQKSR